MRRLWISHESDSGKGTGSGANEEASAQIYWKSPEGSALAASIKIVWKKDSDLPTVTVKTGVTVPPENIYNFRGE